MIESLVICAVARLAFVLEFISSYCIWQLENFLLDGMTPTHRQYILVGIGKRPDDDELSIHFRKLINCPLTCSILESRKFKFTFANGIRAALSNAWIHAGVIDTWTIVRAFNITLAFAASAVCQWITGVARQAGANWAFFAGVIVSWDALGIRTAWIWSAQISYHNRHKAKIIFISLSGSIWSQERDREILKSVKKCLREKSSSRWQAYRRMKLPGVNGRQLMNGSPVISRGQLQIGVRPRRLQSAPTPQAPSHGFLQMP